MEHKWKNGLDLVSGNINVGGKHNLDKHVVAEINKFLPKPKKCDECMDACYMDPSKIYICAFCRSTNLCEKHNIRAIKYGRIYRGISKPMCDNCCWWEIS